MRVLAVSSYGGLGGAELSIAAFIANRPAGVDVDALLVSDDEGELREHLGGLGIRAAVARGYDGRPGPREVGRFTRGLAPFLRWEQPDVVWATGQKAALLCAPACRATGVPLVWHKVDFSWDRELGVALAAAVTGVIGVSHAVAEALGPLRERKLLGVVGPPLRLPEALRVTPDQAPPAIGTLARLVPYKGHHHIARAGALLSEEFPDLRVVLAGAPAPQYPGYPDELRALAAETGLGERLELPGFVGAPETLARLTVFVNATYRDDEGFGFEGLSGAMLEASWAGLPVVAAVGGGTAEGVREGETGTLVPDPAPEVLAAAIAPYLRDPALARRTGDAGAAFAREHFAPRNAAKRLFGLLARACRPLGVRPRTAGRSSSHPAVT